MTKSKIIISKANQPTKARLVDKLLRSNKGASLDEIMQVTGWQVHSCRAFLTGLRKKDIHIIRAKRKDGTTFYRIGKESISEQRPEKVDEGIGESQMQGDA